jgi:hypothetical protein
LNTRLKDFSPYAGVMDYSYGLEDVAMFLNGFPEKNSTPTMGGEVTHPKNTTMFDDNMIKTTGISIGVSSYMREE